MRILGQWMGMLLAVAMVASALAAEIPLVDKDQPNGGWNFDNGREFKGATGSLTLDAAGGRDGGPALCLKGDFTQGGNYVDAGRRVDNLALDSLSFWLKSPGRTEVTLRLIDAGGTCHQVKLKVKNQDDWQLIQFPAASFFSSAEGGKAGPMVAKYEHWGKDKTGQWQGPLKGIHFILGKTPADLTPALWLSQVTVVGDNPKPLPMLRQTIALDEVLQAGENDWEFTLGQEFKGAKGAMTVQKDVPEPGKYALKVAGDFTGGGAYVAATKQLPDGSGLRLESLTLTVRTSNCAKIGVRIGDGTNQCHQKKGLALQADGQWHDLVIKPAEIAGGEHWGGANDGQFHAPAKWVSLILNPSAEDKQPVLEIAAAKATVLASTQVAAAAWKEGFEAADCLAKWELKGDAALSPEQPFAGKNVLRLSRSEAQINTPAFAVGPSFPAQAGNWQLGATSRPALYSPDTSYMGATTVEWLDAAGKVLEKTMLQEATGTRAWQPFEKSAAAPAGTVAGRFRIELVKTYGTLAVDELSAAQVQAKVAKEERIARVMVVPTVLGGCFLPSETPTYKVSVWAPKPLRPEELTATASVTDYWGAEQGPGVTVTLAKTGYKKQAFQYEGELKLSSPALAAGKFYRLHVDVPVAGQKPFRYTIGVAALPEAATRKYPPEAIPFSIRNWDNRIKDYFFLTDRLGIRLPGIWGGWSEKAPYKAHGPGIEFCEQLGMHWITGSPAHSIEQGETKYTPESLSQGMTNFLKDYAKRGISAIALGNEPHGGPEQIAKNVAAYKAVYEAVKAFDPSIVVYSTSVEPNEEYFRQGYYKYCDAYDFHTYESYPGIRETIRRYQELMKKYNAVKPIVSTELGLNCQGMSRLAVASEMAKKFPVFFAAGGSQASWFTIMYPDSEGKGGNTSGAAFQVFDCRYNAFNPKLDAVTLYQTVNAFCDKKFVAEQLYPDHTQAYLFANAQHECLQMLWNEKARLDVGVPLAGAKSVRAILIDGTEVPLTADYETVTVTVSGEPVMLLYTQEVPALAPALTPAQVALAAPAAGIVKGQRRDLKLQGPGLTAAALRIGTPPGWQTACRDLEAGLVACTVTAPAQTDAQTGRLTVAKLAGDRAMSAVLVEVPVENSFGAELMPTAAADGPGVRITLKNHNQESVNLHWRLAIDAEYGIARGSFRFAEPGTPKAFFGGAAEGTAALAAGASNTISLSLRDVDPQTLYRLALQVNDDAGHEVAVGRFVAGFAAVHKATPTIDGKLDEACWKDAPVARIGEERQFYPLSKGGAWRGPEDLTAAIRYLWDDQYLYFGVEVNDDKFVGTDADGGLWHRDGLQFLADPMRASADKPGKYDYALGLGPKGPQMCCHSSASPETADGVIPDVKMAAVPTGEKGNVIYEVAVPWKRLAPFVPAPGADLGLSLIVNDDDGKGRNFIGWFSGVHSKELDMVGDLILQP